MADIETTCTISLDTLDQSVGTVGALEDTSAAMYVEATNRELEFERDILKDISYGTAWPDTTNGLLTIAAMPHATCDARLWTFLKDPYSLNPDYVRWAAASALLRHCNPHQVEARATHEPRVLAELASVHLISDKELLAALSKTKEPDIWAKFADSISPSSSRIAMPILEQIARDHSANPDIRRRAVTTLHRLHIPSQFAESLFYDEETYVQQEAYSWRSVDEPAKVVTSLLDRFNDASAATYIPQIFLATPLTDKQWSILKSKLAGSQIEQQNAVAVIEMRGPPDEALALLVHSEREIREEASQYVGYRADLAQVRDRLSNQASEFPSSMLVAVSDQVTFRASVVRIANALPCSGVVQYLDQLHAEEQMPGLRLWLESNAGSFMSRCALR